MALRALGLYLALAFLLFGVPVAAHPGREIIGTGGDPQIFVWSLAWWPHAILHWQNPVVTHAVWPPVGLDLAWVSSIPGLALVLSPVTLAADPVVAYNVASVLMPALAAWTAFLLCRHVTRSLWPSLAGGYAFGFSSYMLGQLEGHLHMSSVFLLPLVALVVLQYVEGRIGGRALALRLGVLLAGQILLSTEVALTLTLALAFALVAAFVLVPAARARLRSIGPPLLGGYALGAVLTSPFLAYALLHFQHGSINDPALFPGDLLNVVVPTRLAGIRYAQHVASTFAGNTAENGAYLGVPLLAVVAWYAWLRRHRAGARLLVVCFLAGIVAELGAYLHVEGRAHQRLPWYFVYRLPALNNVLPVRFSLYVALCAALALALWASSELVPRVVRIAVSVLALAAIAPDVWSSAWHENPDRPRFFSAGLYRRCLAPGETVLSLPYPAWNYAELWQAESGFRFRLAQASLDPVPPHGAPDLATVEALISNVPPSGGAADIVRLARDQGATTIVLDRRRPAPWRALLAHSGLRPRTVGGVDLYRTDGTLAACRSA